MEEMESFTDPAVWVTLEPAEKLHLANRFLDRAHFFSKKRDENEMIRFCVLAEMISQGASEIVFQVALHFYRLGVLLSEKKHFLMALNKILEIKEQDGHFFETNACAYHLWGQILTALGGQSKDESFLEQAIEKYKKGIPLSPSGDIEIEFYWDLAETFSLLGKKTKEVNDFKQALVAYAKAAALGANLPHFWTDYAETLFHYGQHLGSTSYIEEAIFLFKKVVVDGTPIEDQLTSPFASAYTRAWFLLAISYKCLVELTGLDATLEEANTIFSMALTAIPEQGTLWLIWGELLLRHGYIKKDIYLVDKGLEKLTTARAFELNPHALLAEGIFYLGILLDDFRLIKEGKKRLHSLPNSVLGHAIYQFALGIYFQNEEHLKLAVKKLDELLAIDRENVFFRYLYFEAHLSIYELSQRASSLQIAYQAISRLCEMRPQFAFFHYDCGIIFLKQHDSLRAHPFSLELAVEKFKYAMQLPVLDIRGQFHYAIALDRLGSASLNPTYFEEAISLLHPLLERVPDSIPLQLQLGLCYFHLGATQLEVRFVEAGIILFESILEQEKEDDRVWLFLGQAHLLLSELKRDENFKREGILALMQSRRFGNSEAISLMEVLGGSNG